MEFIQKFWQYMSDNDLNITKPRLKIAETLSTIQGHHTQEELYHLIRQGDSSIGQTTVYRTLKLLCDAGLAREIQLGDGCARYEIGFERVHHDHLMCEKCGKLVEFTDAVIEERQNLLAEMHGFKLTGHSQVLLGICPDCISKE